MSDKSSAIVQFESTEIRRIWDEESQEWFFAVVDVIEVLTESTRPGEYWRKMKKREFGELAPIWCEFSLKHKKNGRMYKTDCANVEDLLRIIQSVPSPKAEPFKLWMAKLGRERIDEANDPALAIERLKKMYLAMGHDPNWVENRVLAISINNELMSEWEERGIQEKTDKDLLLDVISKGAFDVTTAEHKAIKGLGDADDLPDNMTDTELIFKMLGEASTREIARTQNAQGIDENETAAKAGGAVAGRARKDLELQSGRPVVSSENALPKPKEPDES